MLLVVMLMLMPVLNAGVDGDAVYIADAHCGATDAYDTTDDNDTYKVITMQRMRTGISGMD